jgi:hypothetical protein
MLQLFSGRKLRGAVSSVTDKMRRRCDACEYVFKTKTYLHCKDCEDFDLCVYCFTDHLKRNQTHKHQTHTFDVRNNDVYYY